MLKIRLGFYYLSSKPTKQNQRAICVGRLSQPNDVKENWISSRRDPRGIPGETTPHSTLSANQSEINRRIIKQRRHDMTCFYGLEPFFDIHKFFYGVTK